MKLLGKGKNGIGWLEIETLSHPTGQPLIKLHGRAQDEADKLGVKEIAVSLSHSRKYAIASVVGISETPEPQTPP